MRVCAVVTCKNNGCFTFPTDELLRSQWVRATRIDVQRKIGWTLRRYSSLCPNHFKPSDFISGHKCRRLKKNVVPSIFPWSTPPIIPQPTTNSSSHVAVASNPEAGTYFDPKGAMKKYGRSGPPIAYAGWIPMSETNFDDADQDPLQISFEYGESLIDYSPQLASPHLDVHVHSVTEENQDVHVHSDTEENQDVQSETINLKINQSVQTDPSTDCGPSDPFSIHKYKHSNDAIHFFTGFETFDKLMFVFSTLVECSNMKYLYGNPPERLDSLEQFYIILMILRRHKEFEDIAMLYLISVKQVSNIFITWVHFMSLQWKNLDLWVDREKNQVYMPLHLVIDETKYPVKKSGLPLAEHDTFSRNKKNINKVKVLIGIAPSGLITYVSPCYASSVTDRQIRESSTIIHRVNNDDEITVDKGNQIHTEILNSDRKVARKRVHGRVIRMLKSYKILTQPMNQTETLLLTDIVFICAMLVNFQSNIINKDT